MWAFVVAAASTQLNASSLRPFGGTMNQHRLNATEQTLFTYDLDQLGRDLQAFAVMTHFWAGGSIETDDALIRYYIDGEAAPSVAFTPARAVGLEFAASKKIPAPWGTAHMGKGAHQTGVYHNFRIPFRTIRITFQLNPSSSNVNGDPLIYLIVRGAENLPVHVGDLELPSNARMRVQTRRFAVAPLERYDLFRVPSGPGMLLMTSISVLHARPNLQYLEACFRYFSPPTGVPWPGLVLSTGGEDYYDSAFYFDAGIFHSPVSGLTWLNVNSSAGISEWSAYRRHDIDPLVFSDGARLEWRHGDTNDPATGHKCNLETGGDMMGDLGPADVSTQAWFYTW